MSPVRLVILMTVCSALAAPFAGRAAPVAGTVAVADVCGARMTLTERRMNEHAQAGPTALVRYVHLTAPTYQVSVDEAFAMVEAQRARQARCAVASSR